ncbi:MAG: hypothetical protein KGR68_12395 [Betaproteobacteria bacterium]|nr:hypothetical protein [Betaproteobacteria bacterium]
MKTDSFSARALKPETALGCLFDQEKDFAHGLPSLMCARSGYIIGSNHAAVVHQQQAVHTGNDQA